MAGIVLLGTLIYSNVLNGEFIFDDHDSITYNPVVKNLGEAFAAISTNRYIGTLSFAINYAVAGFIPFGYHVTNVLIHITNALLVSYLVTLIFMTPAMSGSRFSSKFTAYSTALFFVAHPIQTQAVSYIVQRFASLATLFYLLSIIFYIKARLDFIETNKFSSKRHLVYYFLSIFSVICAMKTKEIAFTLPFAILLFEMYFFINRGKNKYRIFYLVPLFLTLLIIPLSMLDLHTSKSFDELSNAVDNATKDDRVSFSRAEYLFTQIRVTTTYLRLLVLPVKQHLDYDYSISMTFFSGDVLAAFALLTCTFVSALLLFKKYRLISFGIIWFFLTLSVESSIIPIKEVIVEQRVYLPSVGFLLAMTSLADRLISLQKVKILATAFLVIILSFLTYQRNTVWTSEESVWKDVIAKSPSNARGYAGLGIAYKKKGEFDKAVELFKKSLSFGKAYPEVFLHLGDIYYKNKEYEQAAIFYQDSLNIDFTAKLRLSLLNKIGKTYEKLGENKKAIDHYNEAIRRYPNVTASYNNLGVLYARIGQPDNAIQTFKEALKRREYRNIYFNLANVYKEKGDTEKAIETYRKFLSMKE